MGTNRPISHESVQSPFYDVYAYISSSIEFHIVTGNQHITTNALFKCFFIIWVRLGSDWILEISLTVQIS